VFAAGHSTNLMSRVLEHPKVLNFLVFPSTQRSEPEQDLCRVKVAWCWARTAVGKSRDSDGITEHVDIGSAIEMLLIYIQ
jgi:hypothetical protein